MVARPYFSWFYVVIYGIYLALAQLIRLINISEDSNLSSGTFELIICATLCVVL